MYRLNCTYSPPPKKTKKLLPLVVPAVHMIYIYTYIYSLQLYPIYISVSNCPERVIILTEKNEHSQNYFHFQKTCVEIIFTFYVTILRTPFMNGNCLPSPREHVIISRDLRRLRAGGQRLPTKWLNTARLQSQHSLQSSREDLLRHFKFGNRYTDPLLLHTAQPCCCFSFFLHGEQSKLFFRLPWVWKPQCTGFSPPVRNLGGISNVTVLPPLCILPSFTVYHDILVSVIFFSFKVQPAACRAGGTADITVL